MSGDVTATGPIFDGRAERMMMEMGHEIGAAVAEKGVTVVRAEFSQDVQHPTGRYSRSIHAVQYGSLHKTTDGNQIYGPWLAGKSRRNKTTRFKGYTFWRRSVQILQRQVKSIAAPIVARYVARMR
jgi:hypothetical protein